MLYAAHDRAIHIRSLFPKSNQRNSGRVEEEQDRGDLEKPRNPGQGGISQSSFMSPSDYTEELLVEQPAIQLFAELGWATKSATDERFGPSGTLGRQTKS